MGKSGGGHPNAQQQVGPVAPENFYAAAPPPQQFDYAQQGANSNYYAAPQQPAAVDENAEWARYWKEYDDYRKQYEEYAKEMRARGLPVAPAQPPANYAAAPQPQQQGYYG